MIAQLDFVKGQLALRTRAEWVEDAKKSGVPFSTFKKIAYGQTPTPRSDTLQLMYDYYVVHRRRRNRRPESSRAAA